MALDPQSQVIHMYPLGAAALDPLPPSCCVEIPGRENAFLHCGEYVVLREHLTIDAHIDHAPVTLHAKVGRILRIRPIGDTHRRILLVLIFFASEFPTRMIREGAVPPNRRQYVDYPRHVVLSNIVKWFPGTAILSEAFVFSANDLDDGTGAYAVGMENAFHGCYKWEKDSTIYFTSRAGYTRLFSL